MPEARATTAGMVLAPTTVCGWPWGSPFGDPLILEGRWCVSVCVYGGAFLGFPASTADSGLRVTGLPFGMKSGSIMLSVRINLGSIPSPHLGSTPQDPFILANGAQLHRH